MGLKPANNKRCINHAGFPARIDELSAQPHQPQPQTQHNTQHTTHYTQHTSTTHTTQNRNEWQNRFLQCWVSPTSWPQKRWVDGFAAIGGAKDDDAIALAIEPETGSSAAKLRMGKHGIDDKLLRIDDGSFMVSSSVSSH